MSLNLKAAVLTVLVSLLYTLNDAIMKFVMVELPTFQAVMFRGFIVLPLLFFLAWRMQFLTWQLPPKSWRMSWARGIAEIVLTYFILQAFRHMYLSDVIAILQATPLMLTIVAALLFAERVSLKRWGAVVLGFTGVLIIIQPGTAAFDWASLYALGAVASLTCREIITRHLPEKTPDLFPAIITSILVLVFAMAVTPFENWGTLTPQLMLYLAAAALFMTGATYFAITMMRLGDVSFTAPFRYSGIIWSVILGILFFQEWPGLATWTGAGILVISGLMLIKEEQTNKTGKTGKTIQNQI